MKSAPETRYGKGAGGYNIAYRVAGDGDVAGSGIDFTDRGVHALKGVPGEWQLYAVDS